MLSCIVILSSFTKGGRWLFISNKTLKEQKGKALVPENSKSDLEFVLAFDHFPESKTAANIADWLLEGHVHGGLKPSMILSHATDGASNAIGSANAFEQITRHMRSSAMAHYICMWRTR